MLQELTIDNLAIIKHLTLEFQDQMTVLTGETGAGKSIIIDAVGLLAGGRGSQEYIRRGCEHLKLQGQFAIASSDTALLAKLDQLGIDHQDNTLIISRTIHKNGRNVIRVNGQLLNTTTLKEIGNHLVDIQGQNEHQQLLQPETHLGMLDQFGDDSISPLLAKYQQQYRQYAKLQQAVNKKQANEQAWAQRLDMLKYQVKEISDANILADEEEELNDERERLEHYQQINNALGSVVSTLNGDGDATAPVLDMLAQLMNEVESIAQFDDAYAALSKSISDAYYALQDAANEAGNQLDTLEFDDNRLNEIDARLTTIGDLEHKYGDTLPDVLKYYEKISKELDEMTATDQDSANLEDELKAAKAAASKTAAQLSAARRKVASRLETAVHHQLSELYMDKAVFKVRFADVKHPQLSPTGQDEVEFYIQTNPGETMGPLAKIASGGELSRVMLALKTIFAAEEGVTSIIFDEVDTGVSGRVAQAIADKIRLIGAHSQVLCITHLPQVAAVAQHQFLIQKQVAHNRTTTSVKKLNHDQRVDELARMLSGDTITKMAREHAEELLEMGQ